MQRDHNKTFQIQYLLKLRGLNLDFLSIFLKNGIDSLQFVQNDLGVIILKFCGKRFTQTVQKLPKIKPIQVKIINKRKSIKKRGN